MCTIVPISLSIGANRIVPTVSIPHPLGNPELRPEEEKQLFDFVVSRAVMPLTDLLKIIRKNISPKQQNALPNGLIRLKGGELEKEAMPVRNKTTMWDLKEFFGEEFFETKKAVYVTV